MDEDEGTPCSKEEERGILSGMGSLCVSGLAGIVQGYCRAKDIELSGNLPYVVPSVAIVSSMMLGSIFHPAYNLQALKESVRLNPDWEEERTELERASNLSPERASVEGAMVYGICSLLGMGVGQFIGYTIGSITKLF